MQVLQDGLLMGSLISTFFLGKEQLSFTIDTQKLLHPLQFSSDYNDQDAKFLLSLSLAVSTARGGNLKFPSWFQDVPIYYKKCPVDITVLQDREILGHVLYSQESNVLIIVFTGTYNLCLAGVDMAYRQTESKDLLTYSQGMQIHGGFYKTYMEVRDDLLFAIKDIVQARNPQIVITGHSLGAALSHICALDLAYYEPIHYAFAAPSVFNPLAAKTFDHHIKNSYRISNLADIIPTTPFSVMPNGNMFNKCGKCIEFQDNLGSFTDNHTLAYIKYYDISVQAK